MHERLEALKPLQKVGDHDKAAEALKSYSDEFPDDWDGKLMEGVFAQLKGDEETFKRIHDEAQSVIDNHGKDAASIKASPLWQKYRTVWERIATAAVIGIVLVAAVLSSSGMISKAIKDGTDVLSAAMAAVEIKRQDPNHDHNLRYDRDLYFAPVSYEMNNK